MEVTLRTAGRVPAQRAELTLEFTMHGLTVRLRYLHSKDAFFAGSVRLEDLQAFCAAGLAAAREVTWEGGE